MLDSKSLLFYSPLNSVSKDTQYQITTFIKSEGYIDGRIKIELNPNDDIYTSIGDSIRIIVWIWNIKKWKIYFDDEQLFAGGRSFAVDQPLAAVSSIVVADFIWK